jgi:hypothetical protein
MKYLIACGLMGVSVLLSTASSNAHAPVHASAPLAVVQLASVSPVVSAGMSAMDSSLMVITAMGLIALQLRRKQRMLRPSRLSP